MRRLIITATLILGLAASAAATPITFTSTNGNLAASAIFDASGTSLIVTLTNTSTNDVLIPTDVLTALFFTVAGDPTLTPVSALLNTGSTVVFGPVNGGDVGSEWAYENGISGAPGGADEGISSTGLDIFGKNNRFATGNLQGPVAVNGGQYGITSAGDNTATGNTPVTGGEALIKNSVIFTLSGLTAGFDPSAAGAISDVFFQYGTDLNHANTPVPEPGTFVLLGAGLAGLAIYSRRRSSK